MVGAGAAVAVASPALADTTCSAHQEYEFDTSGFNTDLRVRVCLYHGSPTRGAYVQASWKNGGDNVEDNRRKFDLLVIHYQLQQFDGTVVAGSCDLTRRVNSSDSDQFMCDTAYRESPRKGGWSADGYIIYNLDRDGEGEKRIDLTGSPIMAN
jgi:hypothetical protein